MCLLHRRVICVFIKKCVHPKIQERARDPHNNKTNWSVQSAYILNGAYISFFRARNFNSSADDIYTIVPFVNFADFINILTLNSLWNHKLKDKLVFFCVSALQLLQRLCESHRNWRNDAKILLSGVEHDQFGRRFDPASNCHSSFATLQVWQSAKTSII